MPATNDLTPEEEAMFAEHGVPSAGAGSEPIVEDDGGQQESTQEEQPTPTPARDPQTGQFTTREQQEEQPAQQQQPEQPAQQQQPEQQQMVPHAALHAERQRAAQHARQAQLATARLNALLMAQQQQQQQEALPNLEENPAGYVQALGQRVETLQQQLAQQTEERQIHNAIDEDERLFASQQPDYEQASDYYVQSRAQELLQFYPPEQAQQIMLQEARQIATTSWQRGMSAAQTVYALAQARGYQMQPQPQPNVQAMQPNAQGQVAAVRQAQQATRSLSGGGGAGGGAQAMNAQAVLAMSDEEFENYFKLGTKGADTRFANFG